MSKEIVINIAPGGVVSGMHRDELNLAFLGKQKIERASDIRFDDDHQHWRIHLADGHDPITKQQTFWRCPAVGGFPSYNEARDFEVAWLNECLKAQVPAISTEGTNIGAAMYLKHGAVAHA